jgi:hypothetical protein
MSLASTSTLSDVSSARVRASSLAVGSAFVGTTSTATSPISVPPWPSDTVYVKASDPE